MDRVNLIPLLRQPDIHPGQSLFSHLTRRRVGQNVAFQAVMVRVLRRVVDTGREVIITPRDAWPPLTEILIPPVLETRSTRMISSLEYNPPTTRVSGSVTLAVPAAPESHPAAP